MCAALLTSCAEGSKVVVHPRRKNLTLGISSVTAAQLSAETERENARLSWSSSDPDVATVDGQGFVTAVGYGVTRVTAAEPEGGGRGVCTVKVYTLPQSITLRGSDKALRAGRKLSLQARLEPGAHIQKQHRSLTWSSSDSDVAIVDSFGRVTAVGAGVCDITAVTVNGLEATRTVEVTD
ncbi:MAG: Ig-like domain-containing protein [Oscillospiraceae bacterium]|nr:Ig-like domain-containing protein [Oscillospiraceae bacterium]